MVCIVQRERNNNDRIISLANKILGKASEIEKRGDHAGAAHLYKEAAERFEHTGEKTEACNAYLKAAEASLNAGNREAFDTYSGRAQCTPSGAHAGADTILHDNDKIRLRDRARLRALKIQTAISRTKRGEITAAAAETEKKNIVGISGAHNRKDDNMGYEKRAETLGDHLAVLNGMQRQSMKSKRVGKVVQDHTRGAVEAIINTLYAELPKVTSREEIARVADAATRSTKVLHEVVHHTLEVQAHRSRISTAEANAVNAQLARINEAFKSIAESEYGRYFELQATTVDQSVLTGFRGDVSRVLHENDYPADAMAAMKSEAKANLVSHLGEHGTHQFFTTYYAWKGEIDEVAERQRTFSSERRAA